VKRIALIAARDIVATVANRGFVVGLLIMPVLIALVVAVMPRLMSARTPQVRGDLAVLDPTGRVAAELRRTLDPGVITARRAEEARRALAAVPGGFGALAAPSDAAVRRALPQPPDLRLVERPADAGLEGEKAWLTAPTPGARRRLAVLVVHQDAVVSSGGSPGVGTYELYVTANLDEGTEGVIHEGLRQAIVAARLRASNLDPGALEAAMSVPRAPSVTVGARGEQRTRRGVNRALPMVMGLLLFVGVMTGGQTLMTSTVEEKSSRVMEVLLAAVSPLELMAGKLIAQLAVSLLVIALYIALGVFALFSLVAVGLVSASLIGYLLVFFLVSYLLFGALMMAIGAAVTEVGEAQSLMGPVMLMLMVPLMLVIPVQRAPDSTFSIVLSFVPPMNTFAMMARLAASSAPPPAWQVWSSAAIGLGAACAAIWFAAQVFKMALLRHGRPPNLATLIRWARTS
jgi:ABC-2 type transport system permease protein